MFLFADFRVLEAVGGYGGGGWEDTLGAVVTGKGMQSGLGPFEKRFYHATMHQRQ